MKDRNTTTLEKRRSAGLMQDLRDRLRILAVRAGGQRFVIVAGPLLTVVCDCGNNIKAAAELLNSYLNHSEKCRRGNLQLSGDSW